MRHLNSLNIVAAALLIAAPAGAWEFAETDVCILRHSDPAAEVTIIYDPAQPLYTISLTRPEKPWPAGTDFRIRFDGARPITIGTTRQVISDAGRTVTVSDVGFGNVLDGIAFNALMLATIGDQGVSIPLAGAEGPMADFRACPSPKAS